MLQNVQMLHSLTYNNDSRKPITTKQVSVKLLATQKSVYQFIMEKPVIS